MKQKNAISQWQPLLQNVLALLKRPGTIRVAMQILQLGYRFLLLIDAWIHVIRDMLK